MGRYCVLFQEDFSIIELVAQRLRFDAAPSVFVRGRAFCSLSFRLSGEVFVAGKQQTYHILPQSVFYMPSGYDYTTKVAVSGEMYVIHFWAEEGYPAEPFVWTPAESDVYEKLFEKIFENAPLGRRKDFGTMGQFCRLLARIRADSQPERELAPKRMLRAKAEIHQRFNDSTLTVAELAQAAGLSQVYFRREFKQCFGCQPVEYISNIRIEHAKALLEAGDCSISEAAIRSGYDSISYFSYRFRCITGLSPSQYRDSAALK